MKLKKYSNTFFATICIWVSTCTISLGQFNPKPDSIVNKYGPHTTTYCLESDYLFNNTHNSHSIDTVMQNGHLFQSYFRFEDAPYQDLGAFGTSQTAYYIKPDEELGTQFGFRAWDQFIYGHDEIKYFDTYSPYSRLEYVQGLDGQQIFSAGFSRSVSENFNFGFNLKGFGANKTIGRNAERQRFTDNLSANINARIVSNNKRYLALVNYRYFKQKQNETGGYYDQSTDSTDYNYFDDNYAVVNLDAPQTNMRENCWRLYHQYNISGDTTVTGKIQLFNEIERKKQKLWYFDENLDVFRTEINGTNGDFFNNIYFDSTQTKDSSNFHLIQSRIGLKGTVKNFYYQVYAKGRVFNYKIQDSLDLGWESEYFLGGALRYKIGEHSQIDIEPEVQLNSETDVNGGDENVGFLSQGTQYNVIIRPRFKWFQLELQSQSQAPDAIQKYYVSNHFLWSNNFKNKRHDKAELSFQWKKGKFLVHPFLGIDRFNNFIYYDENALAKQRIGAFNTYHAGIRYKTYLWKFHLLGYMNYYKRQNNVDVIRTPDFFLYQQLYFEGKFKNRLSFQLGADAYFRSQYQAYSFNPAVQQFHLQNDVSSESYVVVDAFMNFKVKSALIFIKAPHVNKLFRDIGRNQNFRGYEITPYYPGIAPTFVFGIEWMFFD